MIEKRDIKFMRRQIRIFAMMLMIALILGQMPWSKKIVMADETITASVSGNAWDYDGNAHGITINVTDPASGAVIKYGETAESYNLDECPTITNVNESPKTIYYQITAEGYEASRGQVDIIIRPIDATIPTGLTATYGQTLADVSLPDGWIWQNSETSVGDVGNNTFKANYTSSSPNYNSIDDVDITVNVQKVKANVTTPPSGLNTIYTGYNQDLLTGGVADTSLEYSLDNSSWSDTVPQEKDANVYTVLYRAKEDENHEAGDIDSVTATIHKKSLTIKANDHNITYGDTPANDGVEYIGFVGADTESDLSGSLSYDYNYSQFGNVGEYIITPDGYTSDNYDITYTAGNLTVEQKELSLNWSTASLTFNGEAQGPTVTATGTVNSDDISILVTGLQTYVGTGYIATASDLIGEKKENYSLPTNCTHSFSIQKAAAVTIPDEIQSVPYSSININASLTGLMPSNAGDLRYSKGNESPISKVNTWTVNPTSGEVTAVLSGGVVGDIITLPVSISSQNYSDSSVNVKITLVNKSDANVSITGDNPRTVIFGSGIFRVNANVQNTGDNGAWSWESSNEDVAEVSSTGEVTIKGGGDATITATYESDSTIGSDTLNLQVNPKTIAIPAAVTGLKWTGNQQTGVSSGEGYTLSNESAANVGNYVATATLVSSTNYKWSDNTNNVKTISWSIGKADGPSAPTGLNGVAPTTSGGNDGKITGVTTYLEYSSDSNFHSSTPCSGTEISGLSSGTYYVRVKETATNMAGTTASVTVPDRAVPTTPAVVTNPPAARTGLVYNGSVQVLVTAGTATGGSIKYAASVLDTAPDDNDYSASIPSKTNAMRYYVWYKAFGDSTHDDSEPARVIVTISKKTVTLSNISASKNYDGSTKATLTANISGVAGKDDLRITADAIFDDPQVGTRKNVNYTRLALSGTAVGNYIYNGETSGTIKADITKRPLTITARDQEVKIDKKIHNDTYYVYVSNLVDGHILSSISLKSSSTEKATDHGTITPSNAVIKSGSTDVTGNYAIFYIDGRLTVKKSSSDSDSSDSDSSSGSSSWGGGTINNVNYNELRGKLLTAALQISAQKAANGGAAIQQQIVTWDKGEAIPYDVMKTLQDNPEITLVFKTTYGGINYVFTIPGSAIKANPLISWYGPLYLLNFYGQYAVSAPAANSSLDALSVYALLNQANGSSGLYIVKRGDTLSKIAKMYNTTASNLALINGIKNPNKIYPGQVVQYTANASTPILAKSNTLNKSSSITSNIDNKVNSSSSTNNENKDETTNTSSTESSTTFEENKKNTETESSRNSGTVSSVNTEMNPDGTVYITPNGKKFHYDRECAGENAISVNYDDISTKYGPCGTCVLR